MDKISENDSEEIQSDDGQKDESKEFNEEGSDDSFNKIPIGDSSQI